MTTPSSFISTSDYATFKNDGSTSTFVVYAASTSVAGNGYSIVSADIAIGKQASINRVQISSSKDSSKRYSSLSLSFNRIGLVGGSAAPYTVVAYMSRTSATNLRCSVYVPNPYSSTLTTATGNETFTFYIDTFLPPFI